MPRIAAAVTVRLDPGAAPKVNRLFRHQRICGDEVWEEPILAQLEGIELDHATISAVIASLGSGPRPVTLDKARIERQIRELALEHAAGRLEGAVYQWRARQDSDVRVPTRDSS